MTLALQRLGLTRNDVTIKVFGDTPRRLAAVKSGAAKATVLSEPFITQAREQGVNVMIDLAAEQIPWLFSGVVLKRGDVTARRDVATRFLKAVIEGNYLALTDPARAKEVLAKELRITDPKILDITYNDFKAQSPADLEISRPGAENILVQFPGGSQKVEDYVDTSLLDALRSEGYFATMQQKYRR